MAVEYNLKSGIRLKYRKFERSDSIPCVTILHRGFKPPLEKHALMLWGKEMEAYKSAHFQSTAKKRDYHVAEVDGCIVGMIGIERFPPATWRVGEAKRTGADTNPASLASPPTAEILDLAVAPEFCGKQVDSALLLLTMLRKIEQDVGYFHAYAPLHALPAFHYAGFGAWGKPMKSIMLGDAHPLWTCVPAEKKSALQDALREIQAQPAPA